ncbi:Hypothetical protein D9617_2g053980 [Elsinoe fawcettii]|nr:Hypothetical protein D9617_2g053980 [Elsinoe fawcettii]
MRLKAPFIAFPGQDASKNDVEEYLKASADLFESQSSILKEAMAQSPQDVVAGLRAMDVHIDPSVLGLPRRKSKHAHLAHTLAARVRPNSTLPILQYEKDVVQLRAAVLDRRRQDSREANTAKENNTWSKRLVSQGPWDELVDPISYDGPRALPMPVELSDIQSLQPFFKHLAEDGDDHTYSHHGQYGIEQHQDVHMLEYEKGVLYSDGRMDLCKMVVGPHNIKALMDALRTNTFTQHFLLGNNVIGPTGARAIADFVHETPDKFETWYLAGNCIDTSSLEILVNEWVESSSITNIWLKRNPLGPSAAPILFRLVTQTQNVRTLDLDQTELGDAGAAEFFTLLADYLPQHPPLALRNLYLNATGLGPLTMAALSNYLSQANCKLESLYLSLNPIGSSLHLLCPGVAKSTSLYRLGLSSCGLTSESITPLLAATTAHPSLRALDLSQSYATIDLSARFNWFDDTVVPSLVVFLQKSPDLLYISLSHVPMTDGGPFFSNPASYQGFIPDFHPELHVGGVTALHQAVASHPSLQWFEITSIYPSNMLRTKAWRDCRWLSHQLKKQARAKLQENVQRAHGVEYDEWVAKEKRYLMSPRDVRFIDSVYRNRDAGKAKRGETVLEKHWKDDDGTLEEVMKAGGEDRMVEGM